MKILGLTILVYKSSGLVMACQRIKGVFKVLVQLLVLGFGEIRDQCVLSTAFRDSLVCLRFSPGIGFPNFRIIMKFCFSGNS